MNKLPQMQMDDLITFSISKPKMKYRLSPVFLWHKILLFNFFFYIQTLIEIINSFCEFRKPLYSLNSHSTANKRKLEKRNERKKKREPSKNVLLNYFLLHKIAKIYSLCLVQKI